MGDLVLLWRPASCTAIKGIHRYLETLDDRFFMTGYEGGRVCVFFCEFRLCISKTEKPGLKEAILRLDLM
jgi:hypothetical protein